MFSRLDAELQNELLEFVKKEENSTNPIPLKIVLVAELLRQIARDEREITGMVTNHKTGDVFVRFSFTPEMPEEEK